MKIKIASSLQPSLKLLAVGLAAGITCFQSPAHGTDIAHLKLTGHWTNPLPTGFLLGYSVTGPSPNTLASNENWIVAGAPLSADQGIAQGGAVQVFNAVTGVWVRKLLPPTIPQPNTYYGNSCAVSGNTAVIGAPGPATASPGAAYVYNLTNGLLLHTLHSPGGVNGDSFGSAVAVSGNWVIVGACTAAGGKGSAYVFSLATGLLVGSPILITGGINGDNFGFSIAAEGNVVIIGAPGVDLNRGAVYAYDLSTTLSASPPYPINKYHPSASVTGDQAGWSVAMHQGKMILGAPHANGTVGAIFVMGLLDGVETVLSGSDVVAGEFLGSCVATHQGLIIAGSPYQASNRGAIYLFDLNSASLTEFQKLIPPDGGTSMFGLNVSICGNQAAMVAPYDDTQAQNSGAAYVMSPIQRPMPLTKVTAKGDFAPGTNESNFGTIGDAFLNSDSEVAFASGTLGYGTPPTPASVGVWNTLAANQPLDLVLRSHQMDGPLTVASVFNPLANFPSISIFQGTFNLSVSPSVTPFTNQVIYKDDGTAVTRILRTGDPALAFGNAQPSSFTQLVQSQSVDRVAAFSQLRLGTGSPITTAANDTGVLWYPIVGTPEAQREGQLETGSGLTYGQFAPRVACYWDNVVYSTAITGPVATNQAVFQKVFGGAVNLVARKGDAADLPLPVTTPPTLYSSFLGESSDDGERVLYHATLTAPATVLNNEGLFLYTPGSPPIRFLVSRKGDQVYGQPLGVKIDSFINFWQSAGSTLALVGLKAGSGGVNGTNNHALMLFSDQSAVPPIVLMRTGDPAPGCGAATISTISRVEIEPKNAHYLVLATLAGAPVGAELVLFRGFANKPIVFSPYELTFRHPVPVLRKGQLFLNQPGKITSISMPASNLTASGAGNTGLGVIMSKSVDAITPNTVVIAVDFANGVHQVMKGIP